MSLAYTTTVLNWLCTARNTSFVSASSCVYLSALTSVVPFDDLISSSSMNPPATTISFPLVHVNTIHLTRNSPDRLYVSQ